MTHFFIAGCAGSRSSRRADTAKSNARYLLVPIPPDETANILFAEPDVRGLTPRPTPKLKAVQFTYDSDRLDIAARRILQQNADYLKAHPKMQIQVAGHCDQRGTVPYNLALGQRRARSVREYYKLLGVEGTRVATISYGNENPLCTDSTEQCWSRNRRGETLEILNLKVAASPP